MYAINEVQNFKDAVRETYKNFDTGSMIYEIKLCDSSQITDKFENEYR